MKIKSGKISLIIILIIVLIIALIICSMLSVAGSAVNANPKDNAYHYMKNGIDDQLYNEWWYFNGEDDGTHFMLTFLLSDPDNLTSLRRIMVQAVLLQEGERSWTGSHYSGGFGADRSLAMFDMDKSGFSADERGIINVWGEVKDEATGQPFRWDLTYESAADPLYAIPTQAKVDQFGWMKWLVYMPSARVTGSITIGNRTLALNGTGYHDHIWGRFPLSDSQFTWAEANDPAEHFSLSYREISGGEKEAYIGVHKDDEQIDFSGRQVNVNYTEYSEYGLDNATAIYPARYNVQADNGKWRLELEVAVQESIATLLDYPWPTADRVDLQQLALLQGTLRSKSGEEYVFQVRGFSGYSS
mgnify:CR=1 FL=1